MSILEVLGVNFGRFGEALRLLFEELEGSCRPLGPRNCPGAKKEASGKKWLTRLGALLEPKLGSCWQFPNIKIATTFDLILKPF